MSEVAAKLDELIQAMKNSDDYRRYSRLEAELKEKPELKEKIDAYRKRSYDMQNSGRDLFDETDYVIHEYEELVTNSTAVAYLDAESSVCRMIQRVVDAINESVSVEFPE